MMPRTLHYSGNIVEPYASYAPANPSGIGNLIPHTLQLFGSTKRQPDATYALTKVHLDMKICSLVRERYDCLVDK